MNHGLDDASQLTHPHADRERKRERGRTRRHNFSQQALASLQLSNSTVGHLTDDSLDSSLRAIHYSKRQLHSFFPANQITGQFNSINHSTLMNTHLLQFIARAVIFSSLSPQWFHAQWPSRVGPKLTRGSADSRDFTLAAQKAIFALNCKALEYECSVCDK